MFPLYRAQVKMKLFKIQLLLFLSYISIPVKELAEGGSKFHARIDLLNLQCISFSASEEETVNLKSDTLKEILKMFSVRVPNFCYLEEDNAWVRGT